MLVVSLLPVGALADGTAEVIGGTYDGINTVEYRIEIAQLYKLLLLYGEGVDDDTKLEGATFEFHENRGYGDSQALLPISAVDRANFYYYYSFSDVADAGDPYNISGLIIKYDDKETYIDASDLRIRYTGDSLYYVEAKNDEKSVVVFYDNGEATTGNRSDYWVYAVRLVDNSETVNDWPEDPDTITYSFLNWTYNPDGTGSIFLENAQVNGDVEVFARKVSGNDTVAGTQIHIMNDGNALLERFVDLYNTKYKADIQVTDLTESVLSSMKITVHGQNGNATNPNYYVSSVEHNGWEDGYYLVYNRDADTIDSGSQLYNKHIPANEITKITIEAKIDGNTVNVEVNRGSAPGEFEVSSSGLDRILNIYFNPIPVATVDYTVNYYYDNAIDAGKTETLTGTVGDIITNVPDKSSAGYCLDHSNLPFTLTADETENVITVYYATDTNGNDIPDYKETKYGVTYQFVSGTDGKVLPDSGMPTPPSDNSTYLIGITVGNKGTTTYESVSVDDGTWTFTGWDANEKVMVEGGITFTGTWTFELNKQYHISYYWENLPDGAEIDPPETQYYYAGDKVEVDTTYYSGYEYIYNNWVYRFQGWDTGALNDDGTMPASDISITGRWTSVGEAPKYNVTYEFEGGAPKSFTPNIDNFDIFKDSHFPGSIQNVPTGLKAESEDGTWTFNGWTSEEVEIENDKFTMPAEDVHLVGTWTFTPNEPAGFDIIYNAGSDDDDVTGMPENVEGVEVGTKQTVASAIPEREGYIFDGWTTEDATVEDGKFVMPEKDVVFTAQWVQTKDVNAPYASRIIYVNLYVDGVEADVANLADYVELEFEEGRNATIDDSGRIRYDVEFYNCLDIAMTAKAGYELEEVDAHVMFGQNGTSGITVDGGKVSIDNTRGVNRDYSVDIYVRTQYEVKFYDAKGNELTELSETGLIAGATERESFGDPNEAVNPVGRTGHYHVNCGCKSTAECEHIGYVDIHGGQEALGLGLVIKLDDSILLPTLPEGDDGWYLNNDGEAISGSYAISAADDTNGDGVIEFFAKEPEPETYTIEVEVINGTAEFMGTNIGADNEIVAAADEDITIAFTPDGG